MTKVPTVNVDLDASDDDAVHRLLGERRRVSGGTALLDAQIAAGDASKWSADDRRAFDAANRLGYDHLVEEIEGFFLLTATRNIASLAAAGS